MPVHSWRGRGLDVLIGVSTKVYLKLELLQVTGTFKARGTVSVMLNLSEDEKMRDITAVSAGNHIPTFVLSDQNQCMD